MRRFLNTANFVIVLATAVMPENSKGYDIKPEYVSNPNPQPYFAITKAREQSAITAANTMTVVTCDIRDFFLRIIIGMPTQTAIVRTISNIK